MEVLDQIVTLIFYILFFSWIFFKIRNAILIKKPHRKELYKDIKNQKPSKHLFKINMTITILFAIYLTIGLVAGGLSLFMMFITLGGTAYIDAGGKPILINLIDLYFSSFKYISYTFYIIIYIFLIRAIYINSLTYKSFKNIDNK